ncbi:MAG: tetratricopeptide repeat protein [Bacteroidales bacterium]|nr:tetratricopeptide repeat protein [Bacteroidales bacterium]
MKTNILTILLLFITISLAAQSPRIDSLSQNLSDCQEKDKSRIYNMLAFEWLFYDLDSSIIYSNKALKLSQNYHQSKEEAMAWFNIGYYNELSEDLLHALDAYNKSFAIYKFLDDKNGMASLASYIGTIYKFTGDYELASKYFHLSLDYYMQLEDLEGVTYAYNNLGILYFKTEANDKAQESFTKSLKYATILHDTLSLSCTYNNLGLLSMRLQKQEQALALFLMALEMSKAIDDDAGIATAYSNIADVYMEREEYDAALNYLSLAELNQTPEFNSTRNANNLLNLAQIYNKTNKPILAEEYFLKALNYATSKNLKPQLENIYTDYSIFLSLNKRHAEANEYLFMLAALKDSIYTKEISSQIANANIRVQMAEQNAENIKLEKENAVNEIKIRQWKTSGMIAVISSIIILLLLLLINARVVNLRRQKKALEEKNSEIEGLNVRLNELHEKLSQNMTHRTMQLDSEREKRHEAEKNLQKIHHELKNLQELKNQFIVNLNGEIRSSLNIIIGFSKLLEKAEDKETKAYSSYISNNAEHLYMALQSMLAFEMIENQNVRLNKTEFDLNAFREQSTNYLNKLIPDLYLNETINADLNTFVVTDRDLLLKLINDSIKFLHNITDEKQISVDVNLKGQFMNLAFYSKGTDSYVKTISKLLSLEGAIDLKTLSKEDAYLYSSLFYIKSLIKAFDFEIDFTIEENIVKFSYFIPLHLKVEEKSQDIIEKDRRFAIVESYDKISTLLLQKKLEEKGSCEILSDITYSNTENLKNNNNLDMIFLDIPSEDIEEWARSAAKIKIKENLPPVVAVSAYLTQEDIDLLLNAGFTFYLNKPIKSAYLYKIIEQLSAEQ